MSQPEKQHLLLFISGANPVSEAARAGVEKLREMTGQPPLDVQVIDILEDFETAQRYGVYITPTLLWKETNRRVLGDLTVPSAVSRMLGLS